MPVSLLGPLDLHLFNEGTHRRLGEHLGAHPIGAGDGTGHDGGVYFAVWAPSARRVSVVGEWNDWDGSKDVLVPVESSGIFEGVASGARLGQIYKYEITTPDGRRLFKADPMAFSTEVAPRTGSVIWKDTYDWGDGAWMAKRAGASSLAAPMSIYEVHLGSWRRSPEHPEQLLGYDELGPPLVSYLVEMGFTHLELLPIMEHPFYGSWGYQCTGYFAPTSRYGPPEGLMALIDACHRASIGVILDWVPSHFPTDAFALGDFDGTHLYEHADPRQGFHPDWNSYIFNYGRNEVRSFLSSSAEHWLSVYHADGLRVDAVASMLYLDYSRGESEWIPNAEGGRDNLEAIWFLRQLNTGIYAEHPDVQTIAEESTAWPGVSRPVEYGGLGFGLKWDMGWMHDTLVHLGRDPIFRRYHQGELTFRGCYAFSENFVLPLSHDEIVHGKGSLLDKMPGDVWQKMANLRLLIAYQFASPGKKLLFMGDEFGQWREWDHDRSLDWHLLDEPSHAGIARLVASCNKIYRSEPALHDLDCDSRGMELLLADADAGLLVSLRWSAGGDAVLAACNFTPVARLATVVGNVPSGRYHTILDSDDTIFGGSGAVAAIDRVVQGDPGETALVGAGGRGELVLDVPPLGCVLLARERR